MYVTQIAVFLENKVGRLAETARILAEADINIRALSLADTSDFGVLRLIVNDNEKAQEVLKHNGLTVRKSRVVAVSVADRPGGLLQILDLMDESGINIEYMYAYANPKGGSAIMIFRFEPMERAVEILNEKGLKVLSAEELSAM